MNIRLFSNRCTTILALSWRDVKAPEAGGAEIYTHEILRGAVKQGMRVIHISPMFSGADVEEEIEGVLYLRKGNSFSVIWHAYRYYERNHENIEFVIDQCNTHRFFTKFWVEKNKRIFLIFQLTREIWKYHLPFPFSWIGMWFENAMLRLSKNDQTITESESTKKDLIRVGFHNERIHVIPVGLSESDMYSTGEFAPKMPEPTFIYVGRYAKYKGIENAIVAMGLVKNMLPSAKLWIVGKPDNKYLQKILVPLCNHWDMSIGTDEGSDIVIKGFVSEEEKVRLQSVAHALLFPSVREGWGMIVSEAASVGTPSIVFDSPGCRDAVDYGKAGYICKNNTNEELARLMLSTQCEPDKYESMRTDAFQFSNSLRWKNSVEKFVSLITLLNEKI